MEMTIPLQVTFILRLLLASACGMFIGIERKNRAKGAGVRTHSIVSCASALMMIISKYAFFDTMPDGSFDGSRIAAQIVSGIGFLGTGMIFVHKNNITGLTTAAGVWATAGIGMAHGSGMYVLGFSATLIILVIQYVFHRSSQFNNNAKLMTFSLYSDGEPNFQKRLYEELQELDIAVISADVSKDSEKDRFYYMLTIDMPHDMNEEILVEKYSNSRVSPA